MFGSGCRTLAGVERGGLYGDVPPGRFDIAFQQTLDNVVARGGRIKFNLESLDVSKALAGDPNFRVGRFTEWQLQQIVRNKSWFSATDFYLGGKPLDAAGKAAKGLKLVQ